MKLILFCWIIAVGSLLIGVITNNSLALWVSILFSIVTIILLFTPTKEKKK